MPQCTATWQSFSSTSLQYSCCGERRGPVGTVPCASHGARVGARPSTCGRGARPTGAAGRLRQHRLRRRGSDRPGADTSPQNRGRAPTDTWSPRSAKRPPAGAQNPHDAGLGLSREGRADTWMNPEDPRLNAVSRAQRDRRRVIPPTRTHGTTVKEREKNAGGQGPGS